MTVIQYMSASNPNLDQQPFFGSPGTVSAPSAALSVPVLRLVVPLIATASLAFGTVASVSPADAAAYQVRASQHGTSGPQQADPSYEIDGIASLLAQLRITSGLTLGELASALGVSRRAIHHWAAGSNISARHLERLRDLARLVSTLDTGNASETRLRLSSPNHRGESILDRFTRGSQPRQMVPLSTQRLANILEGSDDADATAPKRPVRDSSLGSKQLGRPDQEG